MIQTPFIIPYLLQGSTKTDFFGLSFASKDYTNLKEQKTVECTSLLGQTS